jgi:hypothetical protein
MDDYHRQLEQVANNYRRQRDRERATVARVRALADEWNEAIEPDGTRSFAPVRGMAVLLRNALGDTDA